MAKQLQLLRNQTKFETKTFALTGLDTQLKKLAAGEPAIASYTDGDKVGILLGISYGDGTNYQIFEGAKIGEGGNLEIPQEVQDAIKDAVDSIIGGASDGYDTLKEIEDLMKAQDGKISGLQSELNATQAGAGLNDNGSYVPEIGSKYIDEATSLKDADKKLDGALKAEEEARIAKDNELEKELDALSATVTKNQVTAGLGITVDTKGSNTVVSAKVKVEGNALKVDEENGLYVDESALEKYQGNEAIAVSKAQDGVKTISLTIDPSDKVLSQSGNGLLSTLSLKYIDKETSGDDNAKLQLVGKGDTVITDLNVNDFVMDGMLSNVTLEGNILTFTFNTDGGSKQITVDLSNYIDVYTAGNGISIEGQEISAKVDATSDSFLTVGSDGIKLSGVQDAIDKIETSVGLSEDGSYIVPSGNYTTGSANVMDAISKLDTQVKTNTDAIATTNAHTVNGYAISTNPTLNGADIKLDKYTKSTGTNDELTILATDTVNQAFGKLEKAILDNEEVCSKAFDAVAKSVGLNREGMAYVAPEGSNYLGSAQSVKDADKLLDAEIKKVSEKVTSIEGDKNYVKTVIVNGITGTTENNTATVTIDGSDITLTDYDKGSVSTDITVSDTINTAFGKVENKISTLDGNVLKEVVAGDGISVTVKADNSQTISISADAVWDCGVY